MNEGQPGSNSPKQGTPLGLGRNVTHGSMSSIKRDVKEKTSPSTGGREDFSLEIQPTVRKCPSISLEGFCSGLSALPVGFIFR
jgi:hypothetical protein